MAIISLVQKSSLVLNDGTLATMTASLPVASTAGNLLVGVVASVGSTCATPTGWTLAIADTTLSIFAYIFYFSNAPSTSSFSVTLTSAVKSYIAVAEYSGCNKIAPFIDKTGFNNSGGTSGSITTTTPTDLLIAILTNSSTSTYSGPTNSFVIEGQGSQVTNAAGLVSPNEFVSSTGFYSAGLIGTASSMVWLDRVVSSTGTYSTGLSAGLPQGGVIASFTGTGVAPKTNSGIMVMCC